MDDGINHLNNTPSTVIYKPGIHLFCPKCNAVNFQTVTSCAKCGAALTSSPSTSGSGINLRQSLDTTSIILSPPNLYAFHSFNLSLAAIIPVVGLLLGPAAIVLGFLGLAHFTKHPESKGRKHAIKGIVIGSLALVANVLLLAILFIYRNS